jgi:hypothetical protein
MRGLENEVASSTPKTKTLKLKKGLQFNLGGL